MKFSIEVLSASHTKVLRPLMQASFGLAGNIMALDRGKITLLCKQDDKLLGAVVLGEITYHKNKKIGLVKYIFTAPEARGLGVASRLLDEAIHWFAVSKCTEVVACVEGYNTASSNLFIDRQFKQFSFIDQVRKYQHALPKVWLLGNHFLDLGYFWWSKTLGDAAPEQPRKEHRKALAITVIIHTVLAIVLALRYMPNGSLSLVWQAMVTIALIFAIRFIPMKLYAHIKKYPLRYRPWETGIVLASLITLLFSGVFMAFGEYYPKKARWKESQERRYLARIALTGAVALIISSGVLLVIDGLYGSPNFFYEGFQLLIVYLPVLAVFDMVLAFFPINSYAGGRIRKVYPKTWALLTIIAISVLIIAFII